MFCSCTNIPPSNQRKQNKLKCEKRIRASTRTPQLHTYGCENLLRLQEICFFMDKVNFGNSIFNYIYNDDLS